MLPNLIGEKPRCPDRSRLAASYARKSHTASTGASKVAETALAVTFAANAAQERGDQL
jgi:hypothetical protein